MPPEPRNTATTTTTITTVTITAVATSIVITIATTIATATATINTTVANATSCTNGILLLLLLLIDHDIKYTSLVNNNIDCQYYYAKAMPNMIFLTVAVSKNCIKNAMSLTSIQSGV